MALQGRENVIIVAGFSPGVHVFRSLNILLRVPRNNPNQFDQATDTAENQSHNRDPRRV